VSIAGSLLLAADRWMAIADSQLATANCLLRIVNG
jgi:hypothetical protein